MYSFPSRSKHLRHCRSRLQTFQPKLETLEDRTVPATILVDTFADVVDPNDGFTSLQEAVDLAANSASHFGDDVIVLPNEIGGVAGTHFTSGIVIDDNTGKLTIESSGGTAHVHGLGGFSGVFFVTANSVVAMNDLAISATSTDGITNFGKLTLTASSISGGDHGVENEVSAEMTIIGSRVTDTFLGGIRNDGLLTVRSSIIDGNRIYGALNTVGSLTVIDSIISSNEGTGIANQFGGAVTISDTTISDNTTGDGVRSTSGTLAITGSTIQNNTGNGISVIETQAQLFSNLITGNAGSGIVFDGAVNNVIGNPAAGNTIAFNGGDGLTLVNGADGVSIRGNAIFANGGLAIDLDNDGLTGNDNLDGDLGSNEKQNTPVLIQAVTDNASTTIIGIFNSKPGRRFLIDFYANTPFGSAAPDQVYLGATFVDTDSAGNADFEVVLPTGVPTGWNISATATTSDTAPFGDTSEFSQEIPVVVQDPPPDEPPLIENVVINDGAAQRSMVTSITVAFNEIVTIEAGAFTLVDQNGAGVDLIATTSLIDGRTVAELTFSGANIVAGSLADGSYTFTIHGIKVKDSAGQLLDGDGDGNAGGNHTTLLHRLFGDSDGDGDVDKTDRDLFQSALGSNLGDAVYLAFFDADGDGDVDNDDRKEFNASFKSDDGGKGNGKGKSGK